jgi:hypothetical protein
MVVIICKIILDKLDVNAYIEVMFLLFVYSLCHKRHNIILRIKMWERGSFLDYDHITSSFFAYFLRKNPWM